MGGDWLLPQRACSADTEKQARYANFTKNWDGDGKMGGGWLNKLIPIFVGELK